MQEFSSISVSSFDAASLAEHLTEQSAQGWTVVAIVPAGSSITAYLSRPAGDATAAAVAPAETVEVVEETVETVEDAPVAEAETGEGLAFHLAGDETPAAEPEPQPVEPAGWAAAPEPAPAPEPTPEPAPAPEPAPETAAWAPSAEQTPVVDDAAARAAEQAAMQAAAEAAAAEAVPTATEQVAAVSQAEQTAADVGQGSAGAAPAGWYADPAGRFELRYWDGAQWTEHVSRAGQQYTDPPVA